MKRQKDNKRIQHCDIRAVSHSCDVFLETGVPKRGGGGVSRSRCCCQLLLPTSTNYWVHCVVELGTCCKRALCCREVCSLQEPTCLLALIGALGPRLGRNREAQNLTWLTTPCLDSCMTHLFFFGFLLTTPCRKSNLTHYPMSEI